MFGPAGLGLNSGILVADTQDWVVLEGVILMENERYSLHLRGSKVLLLTIVVIATIAVAPALAASGGKGKGHSTASTAACSISNNVVYGAGLPTDQVINFMVTDASGTSGRVLGFTPDGTWTVNVAAPNGPTTYEFVSRTYGPNGSKYDVFQSCSA